MLDTPFRLVTIRYMATSQFCTLIFEDYITVPFLTGEEPTALLATPLPHSIDTPF